MHANMTAVTIQSNKIVSNEVKDNLALLEPSYGEKMTMLPTQYFLYFYLISIKQYFSRLSKLLEVLENITN